MDTKRLQDGEVARGLDREPQRSALWSPEPSAVLGGTLQHNASSWHSGAMWISPFTGRSFRPPKPVCGMLLNKIDGTRDAELFNDKTCMQSWHFVNCKIEKKAVVSVCYTLSLFSLINLLCKNWWKIFWTNELNEWCRLRMDLAEAMCIYLHRLKTLKPINNENILINTKYFPRCSYFSSYKWVLQALNHRSPQL